MSNSLVASLVLKLEDQLSGGLSRLTEELDKLRNVAANVQMTGLKNATETVDALNSKIGQAAANLYRMEQRVREVGPAFAAMGRIASGALHGIWESTEGVRGRIGKISGDIGILGGLGGGYGLVKPIEDYAERDKEVRQIGLMQGLHGPALDAEIARVNALGNRDALRNGLTGDSVIEAYKDLLGQGLPRAAIDGIIGAHSEAARAYGILPDLLGPVTGALVGNMKIAPNEQSTGGALAAIAKASQGGRFKMEDFSHALPGLTGVASSLGMTGRGSLNELAAALEMSTKTAVDPTQAGVNVTDLLSYLTSNREDNLARKKLGIDLPSLLLKGEKDGTNPLDTYLSEIMKLTAGKSPVAQAQAISSIVTNQQARMALLALVQHHDEFERLRAQLATINADKLQSDHASAMQAPDAALKQFQENTHQLSLTLGQSFTPALIRVNAVLGFINDKLTYLNRNFPQTTGFVLGALGAFLGLAAVLGTIGFVWPAIAAGFQLLMLVLSPFTSLLGGVATGLRFVVFGLASMAGISAGVLVAIGAVAAVLLFIVLDIVDHWKIFKPFFTGVFEGLYHIFNGFAHFVAGIFTGNMKMVVGGLKEAWGGVAQYFHSLWDIVKQIFIDFGAWVDGWTGGLVSKLTGGIGDVLGKLAPGGLIHGFDNSAAGRFLGLNDKPGSALAGAPGAAGRVDVHITTEPGVKASATSSSAGVNVVTPNRGGTVSRP